jgi:hypothetical protein
MLHSKVDEERLKCFDLKSKLIESLLTLMRAKEVSVKALIDLPLFVHSQRE